MEEASCAARLPRVERRGRRAQRDPARRDRRHRLHRPRPRPLRPARRGRHRGRRCLVARARRGGRGGAARCPRVRERRGADRLGRRRRGPHLHAEPSPRSAHPRSPRCGQARRLREAGGARRRRPPSGSSRPRRERGTVATVPFVYRYYPTVREARARVRNRSTGSLHLLQGGYLQDWLLLADDDNWRVDSELGGASRAFADIGSHWCDLVEFVSAQRIVRLHGADSRSRIRSAGGERGPFVRARRRRRRHPAPRRDRGHRDRHVRDRRRRRRLDGDLPGLRRAARTGSGSSWPASTRRSASMASSPRASGSEPVPAPT